ncbi:hypothetical protein ACSBR2_013393 [Camellia fascicularis]
MCSRKLCQFCFLGVIAYFTLRFWEDPNIPTINFSVVNAQRSAVQALIVVPTREPGMQVTKVARMLAVKPTELGDKACCVMALLDGGMLRRHKSWLKAEPPTILVATLGSLCQMIDKEILKLDSMQVLVIDESEKSKKAGHAPPITLLIELLKTSLPGCFAILILEEDMNFNLRAASLFEMRQERSYLLMATDVAARGVDLPETSHIHNFDLPKIAVDYLHRAGRTGRKPFSGNKCYVSSIITSEERFVLQRFENELMFQCTEVFL